MMARVVGTYGDIYDPIDVPLVVHAITIEQGIKRLRASDLKLGDVIWVQTTQRRYRVNERWAPRRVLVLHYNKTNSNLHVIDSNGPKRDRAILDQFDTFVNTDTGKSFIDDSSYYSPGFHYSTGRGGYYKPSGPNNSYVLRNAVILCREGVEPETLYHQAEQIIKDTRQRQRDEREAASKEEYVAKTVERLQTEYGQAELHFAQHGIEARYSETFAKERRTEDATDRLMGMVWSVHLNEEQATTLLRMLDDGTFPRGTVYPEGTLPAAMVAARKRLNVTVKA